MNQVLTHKQYDVYTYYLSHNGFRLVKCNNIDREYIYLKKLNENESIRVEFNYRAVTIIRIDVWSKTQVIYHSSQKPLCQFSLFKQYLEDIRYDSGEPLNPRLL